MSEAEQAINVSEWKELHAELEEVSDKHNRLQAENNRLKTLIQLTQKECDEAKNELRDMTAERDKAAAQWRYCCEDRSREMTALQEQLAKRAVERDKAVAQLESLRVEYLAAKEAANTNSDKAAALIEQLRDAALAQVATVTAERDVALADVRLQLAAKNVIITERDAAELERTESRAEVVQLRIERDAARAEAEGLRTDLLAHPPSYYQELAIERKRHLELSEDYDRQNVRITMLEDTIKRTENLLKVALDDRLKGFLAVISQLADQAQDLLP